MGYKIPTADRTSGSTKDSESCVVFMKTELVKKYLPDVFMFGRCIVTNDDILQVKLKMENDSEGERIHTALIDYKVGRLPETFTRRIDLYVPTHSGSKPRERSIRFVEGLLDNAHDLKPTYRDETDRFTIGIVIAFASAQLELLKNTEKLLS